MISGWWLVALLVASSTALIVFDSWSDRELHFRKQSIAYLFLVAVVLAGLQARQQFGYPGLLMASVISIALWFSLLRLSVLATRYCGRWQPLF